MARGALGLLMLGAAALYWRSSREFTFFSDEWSFILERRGGGLDDFLQPHVDHFSAMPVAAYKVLFRTAGLDDYGPYRAAGIALHLLSSGLVFVLARRRVGDAAAVAAAAAILFLGSAWEDIIWPFQIGFLGATAAGLGAWLALDRRDRAGDVAAAVLLMVSLASSSLATAFAAAALVRILWTAEDRRRVWVVLAPGALFAIWYLAYGTSAAELDNVPVVPSYAATSLSASVGALTGLGLDFGRPLAVVGAVLLVRRLMAPERIPAPLVGALAAAAVYFVSLPLARAETDPPTSVRYLYPGAVFAVLIALEALAGRAPRPRAVALVALAAAMAAVANLDPLRDAALVRRQTFDSERAELAAVEIARDRVDGSFRPLPAQSQVTAGPYLRAVDDLGSPAYSEAELGGRAEPVRARADAVLAAALPVTLAPGEPARTGAAPAIEAVEAGRARARGPCVLFQPARPGATLDLTVSAGGMTVDPGAKPVEVRLRRFADAYPAEASHRPPAGQVSAVVVPPDRSKRPWRARVSGNGPVEICPRAGA